MISILQTAFLGDTLLTIPLVKALKLEGHRIQLICREGLGSFFEQLSVFDSVIEIRKGNSKSYEAALGLLHPKFELISPHESPRSQLFALKARRRGIRTVGYGSRSPFDFLLRPLASISYSDSVKRPMQLPEALRQLALLEVSTSTNSKIWRDRIEGFQNSQKMSGGRDGQGQLIPVPEWASMELPILSDRKQRLASAQPLAVLAPGSVWATKRWTTQGFADVGVALAKKGLALKIIGTKEESGVCEEVAAAIRMKASLKVDLSVLAGQISLWETAEAIADASIAITNDSGAMHLAAVAGTPTVTVFGPTVLDFGYRPWSNRAQVIEPLGELRCRPCGKHGSQKCPIGTHECMRGIDAARVINAVQSL